MITVIIFFFIFRATIKLCFQLFSSFHWMTVFFCHTHTRTHRFFCGSIYSENVCGKCDSRQKTMRKRDIKIYTFPMAIMPLASHLLQINSNMKMSWKWMEAERKRNKHWYLHTHITHKITGCFCLMENQEQVCDLHALSFVNAYR